MTCRGAHWFAYRGQPGTSSPTCTRYGCDAPNPRYDRDRDPKADPTWNADVVASLERERLNNPRRRSAW